MLDFDIGITLWCIYQLSELHALDWPVLITLLAHICKLEFECVFLFLGALEFPTFSSTACCLMSSSALLWACWFESPPSPIMMSSFVSSEQGKRIRNTRVFWNKNTCILKDRFTTESLCTVLDGPGSWTEVPPPPTNHPPLPTQPTRSKQPKLPSIAWLFGGAKAWRGSFPRPLLGLLRTSFNRFSFLFWGIAHSY